ncbi:50S ribosomal protein L10 [Blautia sp. RD014234]|nr:50S ribosomal protein L10 [Blautia parvula]
MHGKSRTQKPVVDEIASSIKDAASVVLVSYKGITVEQDTKMRKELREAGVTYKVYKNTMMNFAFKGTPCEELCQHLEGTNALAVCMEDATAPARILAKYAKDVPTLELVAGVVEDAYYDKAGIEALSKVPSREELLGKLLGSIQSPITNFARVLNQIAEQQGGAAAE